MGFIFYCLRIVSHSLISPTTMETIKCNGNYARHSIENNFIIIAIMNSDLVPHKIMNQKNDLFILKQFTRLEFINIFKIHVRFNVI